MGRGETFQAKVTGDSLLHQRKCGESAPSIQTFGFLQKFMISALLEIRVPKGFFLKGCVSTQNRGGLKISIFSILYRYTCVDTIIDT